MYIYIYISYYICCIWYIIMYVDIGFFKFLPIDEYCFN